MGKLVFPDESFKIVGACFEVYNMMGCGFLEPVFQECLNIEFDHQRIPHVSQPELQLTYRGCVLECKYKPDFVCYSKIIVEIKAVEALADEHRAQVLNYLHATGFKLGLLINFGQYPKLQYERLAHTDSPKLRHT